MSYAVKKDLSSWKTVDNESLVLEDEFFSLELPKDPVSPTPTEEDLSATSKSLRDSLLSVASLRIGPLKDAEEDGVATEDELAKLKLWKDYRIALNRIEGQEGFPNNISWPESPEA